MFFRYLTAGESHGRMLTATMDGVPAGIPISPEAINTELARRQKGYGRGNRMKIETDTADIVTGVRFGKSFGAPITLLIENRDWKNWTEKMKQFEVPESEVKKIQIPRPGHADFSGRLKFGFDDIRPVIERSSARETAARVAICSIARAFLKELGIEIGSYLSAIGPAEESSNSAAISLLQNGAAALNSRSDASPVRMLDTEAEAKAIALIDDAKKRGDTLGGIIDVFVTRLPIGLGSYTQHDRKLDAAIAAAIISIQAVKGVEIGTAFRNAKSFGSEVHDELGLTTEGLPKRKTNRAGGMEGSMTNGETLHVRVAMKPISTLMNPLQSVSFETGEETLSHIERSDVCAAPACGVIAEAVLAPVLANAIMEKFGGDSVDEIQERLKRYREQTEAYFQSLKQG